MLIPFGLFFQLPKARGELASALNASATSFSLRPGHGERFPPTNFCLQIDNEIIHVTTRSADALTAVVRGYGDSTAATHAQNALVKLLGQESHGHPIADVDGLTDALAAKQDASAKGQANGYAGLDGTGKVPSAQLPAAGSDPWTVLRLASDFTTTSATAQDVTGLAFTPAASQRYVIEATLMVRTATATVGPRPGCAWPTGATDGVMRVEVTSSATANVVANGNINAAVLAPVGGLPNTTQSWPAFLWGELVMGASPSGNWRLQLASETNGTTVTMKAGSFIRYRTVL